MIIRILLLLGLAAIGWFISVALPISSSAEPGESDGFTENSGDIRHLFSSLAFRSAYCSARIASINARVDVSRGPASAPPASAGSIAFASVLPSSTPH